MGKVNTYKHIFFDLDHTLWDYEKNSNEALGELFQKYQLGQLGIKNEDVFNSCFDEVNRSLWNEYNKNRISRIGIREKRFLNILKEFDIDDLHLSNSLSTEYIALCPTKSHLMPHTFEVLDYLKEEYNLHILTNGFSDVQQVKLEKSNLHTYFSTIVTSDTAGYKKPMSSIFRFAIDKAGASKDESVMIGDNLQTDIAGAKNFGMDTIYFNPKKEKHKSKVTYEIDCLSHLKSIL